MQKNVEQNNAEKETQKNLTRVGNLIFEKCYLGYVSQILIVRLSIFGERST